MQELKLILSILRGCRLIQNTFNDTFDVIAPSSHSPVISLGFEEDIIDYLDGKYGEYSWEMFREYVYEGKYDVIDQENSTKEKMDRGFKTTTDGLKVNIEGEERRAYKDIVIGEIITDDDRFVEYFLSL